MLPRNSNRDRFGLLGYLWLKVGKDVQLRVERVGNVQIVLVTASPAKRFAVLDSFEVARTDSATFKHFLLREIAADNADDADVGKEAG